MFSRLFAFVAALTIVAAGSLAFTASAHQAGPEAAAKPARVIQLETVVVTAKRLPAEAR
jgi:Flp pilus assembly protein CpaB